MRTPRDGLRNGRALPAGRQAPARRAAAAAGMCTRLDSATVGREGAPTAHTFDVVIVGTGPGGYVCAIRAAQLGLSVGVVEDDRPGGVCLNWGCIPTKALLRNAEIVHLFEKAETFGIAVQGMKADYAAAVQRSRSVADRMANGAEFLFRKTRITLFPGTGSPKGRT